MGIDVEQSSVRTSYRIHSGSGICVLYVKMTPSSFLVVTMFGSCSLNGGGALSCDDDGHSSTRAEEWNEIVVAVVVTTSSSFPADATADADADADAAVATNNATTMTMIWWRVVVIVRCVCFCIFCTCR